ncbi:Uncharacterised protein [Vibrio cholerae]|nr:Uncharacterised protein [Vibrio cholerae]
MVTASIPRTERVPVAYMRVNAQPSLISLSMFGETSIPPRLFT